MNEIIDFLLDNYIWVLIILIILIFTLIGYLVDSSNNDKKSQNKVKPVVKVKEEEEKFAVHPSVEVYTSDDFDDPLIK